MPILEYSQIKSGIGFCENTWLEMLEFLNYKVDIGV